MTTDARPDRVFLSYSSKDKRWADAACAMLESKGVRCWVAPRDIAPGTEWGASIISGIDACRVMVLIFSDNANQSPQVRREVERAVSKGIVIMPCRVEDVQPAGALEYALSNTHWLDVFTPPVEGQLQQLVEAVQAVLTSQQPATSSQNQPRQETTARVPPVARPAKTKRSLASRIMAGLLLSISVVVAVFLFMQWRSNQHIEDIRRQDKEKIAKAAREDEERQAKAARENEEKKAKAAWENEEKIKAARARLVLSCKDKAVINIKRGKAELPAITIKVERIECRGEVELTVSSKITTYVGEKIWVPDGQRDVTWIPNHRLGGLPSPGKYIVNVVGTLRFVAGGSVFEVKGGVDIPLEVREEEKAKAARARVVLSCAEKPVITFKKGAFEATGVPPITIKIERIECRGDVKLSAVWIVDGAVPFGSIRESVLVPDGQSVVVLQLPNIDRYVTPKIGIHVVKVEGILSQSPHPDVKGGVDIRVEVTEDGQPKTKDLQPKTAPKAEDPTSAEDKVVKFVEGLGGKIERDENEAGKPVVIVFLDDTKLTDAGLKELKHFKSLQELHLSGTQVTDAGLKELKHFKSLQELHLSDTQLTDAGLKELKDLKGLQELHLSGTQVTDAGLKELKDFKGLQVLSLAETQVTDEGLKELAGLKSLQTLYLDETQVTDAGLKELAGLKQLQKLDLSGNGVTDAGLKELAGLRRLQELYLTKTDVTDNGLKELAKLKSLQGLYLADTGVTGKGLKELAALKQLHTLNLGGSRMADAGLKELKDLLSLRALNLSGTQVTDAGLKELTALKQLQSLDFVLARQVTDAGVASLQKALPNCKIRTKGSGVGSR